MNMLSTGDVNDLSAIIASMLQQKNSNSSLRRIDNTLEWGYTVSIYDVGDVLRIDIKHDKRNEN